VSCALLVIGLLLMRQIAQSPFGYTLRMIRDNAARASFVGIEEKLVDDNSATGGQRGKALLSQKAAFVRRPVMIHL